MLNLNFNRLTVKSRFLAGKTITLVFAILFASGLNSSSAQGTWTKKAHYTGQGTSGVVGFSIGNKGYMGGGQKQGAEYKHDFWEYDPANDSWAQKADFLHQRKQAVGFSIGNKGYVGLGNSNGTCIKDFQEYDPVSNTWTKKTGFKGTARCGAVGFSIGEKGYVGTGFDFNGNYKKDFWEYDPATDSWTKKAPFKGTPRRDAVGFTIGGKGYIGTGYDETGVYKSDFWEYDPALDEWTQKSDFEGKARSAAVGFAISSKGYIGTGMDVNGGKKDFWEYDPVNDSWMQMADFGGDARAYASGFSFSDRGYIGVGHYPRDVWQYDTAKFCSTIIHLSAKDITSTSAKLRWDSVVGAVKYKVQYREVGANDWIIKHPLQNSITITGLLPTTEYEWQVETYCQVDPDIISDWSSLQNFTTLQQRLQGDLEDHFSFQILPNPAEDHATIQFSLLQSSHLSIKMYDMNGKEITTLLNDDVEQGEHSVLLNTNHFSKGVYMVKMISDFGSENQKLIVQ